MVSKTLSPLSNKTRFRNYHLSLTKKTVKISKYPLPRWAFTICRRNMEGFLDSDRSLKQWFAFCQITIKKNLSHYNNIFVGLIWILKLLNPDITKHRRSELLGFGLFWIKFENRIYLPNSCRTMPKSNHSWFCSRRTEFRIFRLNSRTYRNRTTIPVYV